GGWGRSSCGGRMVLSWWAAPRGDAGTGTAGVRRPRERRRRWGVAAMSRGGHLAAAHGCRRGGTPRSWHWPRDARSRFGSDRSTRVLVFPVGTPRGLLRKDRLPADVARRRPVAARASHGRGLHPDSARGGPMSIAPR